MKYEYIDEAVADSIRELEERKDDLSGASIAVLHTECGGGEHRGDNEPGVCGGLWRCVSEPEMGAKLKRKFKIKFSKPVDKKRDIEYPISRKAGDILLVWLTP